MKRFSKSSAIKLFAAIVLVFGLALLGLWVRLFKPPSLMSLDFLKGRAIVECIKIDPRKSPLAVTAASGAPIYQYYSCVQYYSFEADFSDLCKAADAELLPLGFKAHTYATEHRKHRSYSLSEGNSGKTVIIHEGRRFVGFRNMHLPKSSIADGYGCELRDGWVTIRISRNRLPLWPPRYLLYRLKRWVQTAAGR